MPLLFPDTPEDGEIYQGYIWDDTNNVWNLVPIDSAQGIDQLAGVNITSPEEGDALVYNGTDWHNVPVSTGFEQTFLMMGA